MDKTLIMERCITIWLYLAVSPLSYALEYGRECLFVSFVQEMPNATKRFFNHETLAIVIPLGEFCWGKGTCIAALCVLEYWMKRPIC